MITFNKPYITDKELSNLKDVLNSRTLSGNGYYTKKCQSFFETNYGFKKTLLTTSCTDALEMCALLLNIKAGDEVIVPSYTFVSSALAFVREGAKIIFVDSMPSNPNMDVSKVEALITPRTKAIVAVHYAGVAVDMDSLMALSEKYNLFIIEDAAQAIHSYHKQRPLGTIGHLSAFSFHETKNIIAGEGGMLGINDDRFISRAELLWEKGTNRASFYRGEINKYGWVDIGSSFLPSELIAATLYGQLENLEDIQQKRISIWNNYFEALKSLEGIIKLPSIPSYATNNAHMFYIVLNDIEQRTQLTNYLKSKGIQAVFHYLSLHSSPYYAKINAQKLNLKFSDKYTDCLLRLPLYYDLKVSDIEKIVNSIKEFFLK